MTITAAVLEAFRTDPNTIWDMAVLYEHVECRLGYKPNPGSVYRIGMRHRHYGLNYWRGGV